MIKVFLPYRWIIILSAIKALILSLILLSIIGQAMAYASAPCNMILSEDISPMPDMDHSNHNMPDISLEGGSQSCKGFNACSMSGCTMGVCAASIALPSNSLNNLGLNFFSWEHYSYINTLANSIPPLLYRPPILL